MFELVRNVAWETWLITARMSAYLLLGFLVAGLLSVFISPAWLERHLGGRGLSPVLKASLFGVPLPLCSCGVIPVAASLKSHGAGRAATTAFLLSTPQTGVDSIMVTWTLLGPLFAIFRPVAALLTGILGGAIVQALAAEPGRTSPGVLADDRAPAAPRGAVARLRAAWRYGTVTLPADIGRALLVGLLVAGVVGALLPPDFFARFLSPGPLSILLMMVVGIPIYVCATASVPLAASFIFLGISPGAALAFLIAGPATNAATLTTIGRVLGRRTLLIYLATIAASAFGGGLLLDWLLPRAAEVVPRLAALPHHHEHVGWFGHLCGLALVGVMTHGWWSVRQGRHAGDTACATCGDTGVGQPGDGAALVTLSFEVAGMNCSHCSDSVERAVRELAGVRDCRVSLEGEQAVVSGVKLAPEAVIAAIDRLGFRARLAQP